MVFLFQLFDDLRRLVYKTSDERRLEGRLRQLRVGRFATSR